MRASQISDPAILAGPKWPDDSRVPATREKALASAFGPVSAGRLDQIQAQLICWVWALETAALLRENLAAADGVDKEVADGTAAVFSESLFDRMLSSGLTGEMCAYGTRAPDRNQLLHEP